MKTLTSLDIQARIQQADPEAVCKVHDTHGNGYHFSVHVQSPQFKGQSLVMQQKSILQLFQNELRSGELHAMSIKTQVRPQSATPNSNQNQNQNQSSRPKSNLSSQPNPSQVFGSAPSEKHQNNKADFIYNSLHELKQWMPQFIKQLQPRHLVLLQGSLGVGKTTFVQILVECLQAPKLAARHSGRLDKSDTLGEHHTASAVSSPSFTLHNTYQTPVGPVEHIDLYRHTNLADIESVWGRGWWRVR